MRALFRLLRWVLAVPLRILGHRYTLILGLIGITAGFLANRPTDPAFYGVCGGFIALSLLACVLGRWIMPKPRRKKPVLPTAPSRPDPAPAFTPQPEPAPPPLLPEGPPRPASATVRAAVPSSLVMRSPDEGEIRSRLPARLQQLLASP